MTNNKDVFLPFKLHDDGFQPDDDISIRFSTSVTIIEFVLVSTFGVFGVSFGDFFISHTVTDTRIELVQRFPGLFRVRQEASGRHGSLEGRCPDLGRSWRQLGISNG